MPRKLRINQISIKRPPPTPEQREKNNARVRRRRALLLAAALGQLKPEPVEARLLSGSEDEDTLPTGITNDPVVLDARRRESIRARMRQRRANMTLEQRQAANNKQRLRTQQLRQQRLEEGIDPNESESGSSEWTDQSSDGGGEDYETQEEKRERRRAADRERKRTVRKSFPSDALARERELNRLRTQAKRANMTPEERAAARQRATIQARERRAKLRGQEGQHQRLQRQAEAARIRRRLNADQVYPADKAPDPSDVIPGETCGERLRRLQRERRLIRRHRQGLAPVDYVVQEKAQARIIARIERTIVTLEERKLTKELAPWRKRKLYGAPTPLEPEEEDNWAWKDLFCYEMRLEFQKEINILVQEGLEIEVGPEIPKKESPLQDPDWVTKLGETLSSRQGQRQRHHSRATAHDRWQGAGVGAGATANNTENYDDDDDEATNAVLSAFNQVEIKIEAEDYDEQWEDGAMGGENDQNQRNCEDDVADWIARVITGEQEQQEDTATTSTGCRERHSRLAKTQAVKKFQDIMTQEKVSGGGRARGLLGHWKNLAIKRAQDEKLDELRKTYLQARQRWISQKPEDSGKRVTVDEERTLLKEKIRAKRKAGVAAAVQELICKRDFFSHETEEIRASRIAALYSEVSNSLASVRQIREKLSKMTPAEIAEKKRKRQHVTKEESFAEIRRKQSADAMLRVKMERSEYEQHIDLRMAAGLPIPHPKFRLETQRRQRILEEAGPTVDWSISSVPRFEAAMRSEQYVKSMMYFFAVFYARTRSEVISYRRLLVELLDKRRKLVDKPNSGEEAVASSSTTTSAPQETEQYEWIPVPEAVSLQDIERFREFITKYGEPVSEHLSYKRYYLSEKQNEIYGRPDTPANVEKRRGKMLQKNEYHRKRYIRNKYGITLGPGEYFDKKTMSSVKKTPRSYLAWEKKRAERLAKAGQPPVIPVLGTEEYQYPVAVAVAAAAPKPKKAAAAAAPKKKTPAATPRKRGPRKNSKAAKTATSTGSGSGNFGQFTLQHPYPGSGGHSHTTTSRNDQDYSNSGDGLDHQDQDDDSDEGWVPLGSYEIDSVIRHDILNIPHQQQLQQQQGQNPNFQFSQQQQQLSSGHFLFSGSNSTSTSTPTHHHQLRSTSGSGSTHQQHPSYQQFPNQHHSPQIPQLTLVDQFTNPMNVSNYSNAAGTGQWNANLVQGSSTQPLNYSLQFLPNSQISVLQNQQLASHLALASSTQLQQSYGWTPSSTSTSSSTHQNPNYSRNYLPHTATSSHTQNPYHHTQQPQIEYEVTTTPTSSVAPEDSHSYAGSEDVSMEAPPSSDSDGSFVQPKSRGGRPKGSKNKGHSHHLSKASRSIVRKRHFVPHTPGTPRRDIWNNLKRRKYYNRITASGISIAPPRPILTEVESPFERNPKDTRDAALKENITLLLPKCPQCDAVVDDDGALKRHMAAVHGHVQPKPQPDSAAQSTSTSMSTLTKGGGDGGRPKEAKSHWKKSPEKLSCSVCPAQLEGPGSLIEHWFMTHFEARQFKCPFGSLTPSKRWSTGRCVTYRFERNSLRTHVNKKHPEEAKISWIMGIHRPKSMVGKTKFCCLHCDTSYPTYFELKEHYKVTHEKARYCCVHCGIYLRAEDFWLDHVKLFHPEKPVRSPPPRVEIDFEDVFRCLQCDSEFSSKSFLEEHEAGGHTLLPGDEETKKPKFHCPECDKQFSSEVSRDSHAKSCKDTNFYCFWCRSKFGSRDELTKHITDLHPLEPPVPDNRDDCNYSHEPYKCEICKRSYMNLYILRLHCYYTHELYKYLQSIKDIHPPPLTTDEMEHAAAAAAAAATAAEKARTEPPPPPPEKPKEIPTPISSHRSASEYLAPNASLISCPICHTTGHNLHQTHKAYDKLMRRYCAPCERLFSRRTVIRQHNEAAHGMAPDAVIPNPPPCGRPGTISDIYAEDNPADWLACFCHRLFTKEEFHQHHLFFEKDPDIRVCETCSMKFFNHFNYLNHMHSVHGVPKNLKMAVYKKPPEPVAPPPKRELVQDDYDKLSSTTTMSSVGGEITIFSCKVCLKNFKTLNFLRSHIEENHKEDAFTRVLCKKCNTTFATKANLSKHDKFHHGSDLVRYLCYVCDLPITRMDHLKVHFQKLHPTLVYNRAAVKTIPVEEAIQAANHLICKICASSFATETGLKSHMTNKHFPTHWSTFCEFCGLQMNPKAMAAHILKDHPGNEGTANKSIARSKTRLTLPQIVDLVQALYLHAGIRQPKDGTMFPKEKRIKPNKLKKTATTTTNSRNGRAGVTAGKKGRNRKTTMTKSQRKKRREETSSSEEEEVSSNSDEDQDVDDFALSYQSTDEEDDRAEAETNSNADESSQTAGSRSRSTPKSQNQIRSTSRHETTTPKSKAKAKPASRKSIPVAKTPRKRRRADSSSEDEEDFLKKLKSSGTRSRPARKESVECSKKLVISLERCDATNKGKSCNKPEPKLKQCSNRKKKQLPPPPPVKLEPIEDLDLDILLIKDEPEDVLEDDGMMDAVMQHNLESLQWEYVQLPVEEEDRSDLPMDDPLS